MKTKYRVIVGTAIEVENELNDLNKSNLINIQGITATNELTTVIVELYAK